MKIPVNRIKAIVCLVIEALNLAYQAYLHIAVVFSSDIPESMLGFEIGFGWLLPAALFVWSYINAIRWGFYAPSDGETFWWGVGVSVFAFVMLRLVGRDYFDAISQATWILLAHIVVPLIITLVDRIMSGQARTDLDKLQASAKEITVQDAGRFALNMALSAVALAIGIGLMVAVFAGGVFDNSLIVIGVIPIPGQIFGVIPLLLAIAAIVAIWGRD